jgi:uncharacterized membrane protein (UPF0127 family)
VNGRGGQIVLRGAGGRIVCGRCELADTFVTRARGLQGRAALAAGEGLLIRPSFSIHTFFMRFPIDVVFLDRGGFVLDVVPALKPWRTATRLRAKAVLELPAGEAERLALRTGERLEPREVSS